MPDKLKKYCVLVVLLLIHLVSEAQDSTEERGFKKQNLFTGGSVSLSFGTGSFLAGVNPVLGYSLAEWIDAGVAVNYTYASQRGVFYNGIYVDDKLRQSIYGGGVFTRLYPVRFLFAQLQVEHNFLNNTYVFDNGSPSDKVNVSATSTLIGAGYASSRQPGSGKAFGYFAILIDVADNRNSPYKDGRGRSTPIIRGGLHIPLFNGPQWRN